MLFHKANVPRAAFVSGPKKALAENQHLVSVTEDILKVFTKHFGLNVEGYPRVLLTQVLFRHGVQNGWMILSLGR